MSSAHHRRRGRGRAPYASALVAGAVALVGALVLLHAQVWPGRPPSPAASTPTTAAPAPSSTTTTPANPLGPALQRLIATRSGHIAIMVLNLDSGQSVAVGSTVAQVEASTVKVEILAALLAESRGRGRALSASQRLLAQEMIEESDNAAATQLWQDVGAARGMTRFDQRVGLSSTTPSQCVTCAGFAWPGWGLTTSTPHDQLKLLRDIVCGGAGWSPRDRSYMLHLMESVVPSERWGVSAGVPASATVAIKNGWLPLNAADTDWQINSEGWVHGAGRNYLLAMMSTGNSSEQYGIDTLDDAAALVWRFE